MAVNLPSFSWRTRAAPQTWGQLVKRTGRGLARTTSKRLERGGWRGAVPLARLMCKAVSHDGSPSAARVTEDAGAGTLLPDARHPERALTRVSVQARVA